MSAAEAPERSSEKTSNTKRSDAEILLAITELVAGGSALPELFKSLAPLLQELADFDVVSFALYDAPQNGIISDFWKKGADSALGKTFPTDDCPCGWVWKSQLPMTIPDLQFEDRFAGAVAELRSLGIRSYTAVPLSTATERFGALCFARMTPEVANFGNLDTLLGVARIVAMALENRKARSTAEERRRWVQSLLAISRGLNSTLGLDRMLDDTFDDVRQVTGCNFAVIALLLENRDALKIHTVAWTPGLESLLKPGREIPLADAAAERAIRSRSITRWTADEMKRFGDQVARDALASGIRSLCNIPLIAQGSVVGALYLGSTNKHAFPVVDDGYLLQTANLFASAIHNVQTFGEVKRLKDRLAQEKRCLDGELREELKFDDIVGNSPPLKRVLDNAGIVANTDATVLISGETGTGKERIARAIHLMSPRRDRAFIKLNCAAIPTGLLESELFGHERGAFTGAVTQKMGRLELADKGTLLLDEVGEIPLELQPKLLRVLQDQEFERLGANKTIRVDVRLIAATNRDLAQAVENKQFRGDLFYRLHVFPLHLPPLRERREDIPLLIRHFVEKCATRLHKKIDLIPDEAVEAMMDWPWPGNIRELENFIERSVIVSDGNQLRAPLDELRRGFLGKLDGEGTLRELEREHILDILRQTRGVLSGSLGAAGRLGLKRTTLQYKIQKLGIARHEYLD